MRIGILGTGVVGQTLGGKLAELGHSVMIGTRDPAETRARTEPGPYGMPPFSEWLRQHQGARLGSFAEAAAHGEMVVNATSGMGTMQALRAAGKQNLDGKILIDAANPLDFSHGMPPTLSVCNTDSIGEQIQRVYERAKVVKALNTMSAMVMIDPGQLAGGDHTLFMCGNDASAKGQVTAWLREWFGWRDVFDLGDITAARGMEMYLPLWLRMFAAAGTGMINVKVVK